MAMTRRRSASSAPGGVWRPRRERWTRFPVTLLPGRGLVRRLSLRSLLANSEAVAGLCAAVAIAVFSFSKWRPAVVISLGGYASFACVVAASLWRVPVVVVNVDAVPGVANRLAARVAVASAVSSPEVRLPRSVVTGVPVRAGLAPSTGALPQGPPPARLGLPPDAHRSVAVSGGSLGSLRINRAALELAGLWARAYRRRRTPRHRPSRLGRVPRGRRARQESLCLPAGRVRTGHGVALLGRRRHGAAGGGQHSRRAGVGRGPSVLVPLPGSPG